MGLIDKTNPMATRESVIRHAKIFGALTAIVYCGICAWYPEWRELWWLKLPAAAAFGAGIGALMEWQLNDNPDIYEIVLKVEREFAIQIPEEAWKKIVTVGDLFQCVLQAISSSRGTISTTPLADRDAVFERLRTTLIVSLGLDRDEVAETSRFGLDLGVITWREVERDK